VIGQKEKKWFVYHAQKLVSEGDFDDVSPPIDQEVTDVLRQEGPQWYVIGWPGNLVGKSTVSAAHFCRGKLAFVRSKGDHSMFMWMETVGNREHANPVFLKAVGINGF